MFLLWLYNRLLPFKIVPPQRQMQVGTTCEFCYPEKKNIETHIFLSADLGIRIDSIHPLQAKTWLKTILNQVKHHGNQLRNFITHIVVTLWHIWYNGIRKQL